MSYPVPVLMRVGGIFTVTRGMKINLHVRLKELEIITGKLPVPAMAIQGNLYEHEPDLRPFMGRLLLNDHTIFTGEKVIRPMNDIEIQDIEEVTPAARRPSTIKFGWAGENEAMKDRNFIPPVLLARRIHVKGPR